MGGLALSKKWMGRGGGGEEGEESELSLLCKMNKATTTTTKTQQFCKGRNGDYQKQE